MGTEQLLIVDRQKVRDTFGKTENEVCEYIDTITKWFETQPHLPETPPIALIESFLVTNKFSIERCKQCLDMYYSIRTILPEIFRNKKPSSPHMQITAKVVLYFPLPKLTKELYRVCICKPVGDPNEFNIYNCFGHQLNTNEIRLHEDINLGDVLILDCAELRMGHLIKLSPVHLKKASVILEEVFSNRIKGIHIIHAKPFVDKLVIMLKAILKQKLLERLHVHPSIDTLSEYISKDVLPVDYGGEERSLSEFKDLWKLKMEEYQERFETLDKLKVNEDLRPTPLKNHDVLGYYGNFKKLDID